MNASFLLGSITKPIAIAALMTLYQKRAFSLDDPVSRFVPEFSVGSRSRVLIRHLLTHVSGLPDQLPENARLRSSHAPLTEFVRETVRVPLKFEPGTRYEYSSMGILLATEIGRRITGEEIPAFVNQTVLRPLGMTRSALGLGHLQREDLLPCQVEFGAIESGGGQASAKDWDWNSDYWRNLGAPWGGGHASAEDLGRFLSEFTRQQGALLDRQVAQSMITNHNPPGIPPRGLGFDLRLRQAIPSGSERTFGHTGSTGTIAWADPVRDRVCVVLTTLPAQASAEHPRTIASRWVDAIG
jgi:CubicO group peptidase (beta-lactamase class C family)